MGKIKRLFEGVGEGWGGGGELIGAEFLTKDEDQTLLRRMGFSSVKR